MSRVQDVYEEADDLWQWWSTEPEPTDFVWSNMMGYWSAAGQLSDHHLAPFRGGCTEDEFCQLGIEASYGRGFGWRPI